MKGFAAGNGFLALAAVGMLFSCTFLTAPASAQVLYGSIIGTVQDQTAALVPGAAVNITNKETGLARDTTADNEGRYSLVNVLPGRYDVKITAKGFRVFTKTDVDVSPNTVARVDVRLEVGQITDQVTVEASAAVLQTDKSDTHSEITAKAIENIPLGGYRNYQTLINLVPGATPASFQNSITDTPERALRTNINGGNANTNITRIDGAESVNVWLPHHVGYVQPEETVDVVNITTSAADAEQGLAGSSSITLVTKSGTNELHGSAYEFHDDQHLKARNFFQAAGAAKPVGIYNNYGATLGGPIKTNKLFYFVSFDGTNQKSGGVSRFTVPTDDQRIGNFSAYPQIIYDPATGNPDGTGRTAFPNNIIPANRFDAISQKIQSYYPEPNQSGIVNNYFVSGGPILDRDYLDTKVNWNRNERHLIWGKYSRMWATAGGQGAFGIAGGGGIGGADPGLGHTTVQVATLGHTYTISPTLIFDGVLGYQRMNQDVLGNDYGTNYGLQLGIPGTNGPDIRQSGFPTIQIGGYSGFGVPNWMPLFRTDESYTHSDNLTWTKGAHEIRFGFDLVRHHLNHWQPELSPAGPRGLLNFASALTALKGGAAPTQVNGYAAFLLGQMDNVQKGLQYILATGREWQFGWYARDRWQVSKNLTLNLGLRYEFYPLMTRAGYGIERYDPASNQVYMGGRGDVPMDAGMTVSHKLFAPRVGLAYRLGDATVIRAGYGINYDPIPFSRPLRGWYPLTINLSFSSPNSYTPYGTPEQGIPPVVGPDISTGIVPLPLGADERSPWGGEIHRGYEQSWNFTIERKLPAKVVVSAGYVATHSVHLLADNNINYAPAGAGVAGQIYNVLYGRTGQSLMWDGYLSSSYNSLQVSIVRQFSRGLMFKGAYTWSHAIDYTDEDGWAGVNWNQPSLFQRNRATAGFDRTQVFQIGWVYELPIGKGKAIANTGAAAAILGNWQVNGLMACYTGTPFTVGTSSASLNAVANLQTANQVAPVKKLGNAGPGQFYYDPASFAPVTATATYGNTGRNILRNTGTWNTDLSIVRVFPIKERMQLQFRAEFFNFPNTAHFGGVSTSATATNFMQISSASGERQIRLGLRLQW